MSKRSMWRCPFVALMLAIAMAFSGIVSIGDVSARAEEMSTEELSLSLYELAGGWLGCHVEIHQDGTFQVAYDYSAEASGIVSQSGTWVRVSETELTLTPDAGDPISVIFADGTWSCEVTEPNTQTVCHPKTEAAVAEADETTPVLESEAAMYTIRYADPDGTVYYTIETADTSALPEIDHWLCKVTDPATQAVYYPMATLVSGAKVTSLSDSSVEGTACVISLNQEEKTYSIAVSTGEGQPETILEQGTWETKKNPGEEQYILLTAENGAETVVNVEHQPSKEGYAFAGWQTRPSVTREDLILGVSPYEVPAGPSSLYGGPGVSILSLESLEDTTLTVYARWAEPVEIHNAENFRNIAADLYGYYILADDIDLSGQQWSPIGMYFSTYETVNAPYWTFAFKGTLDGAGHRITGLNIGNYVADASAWEAAAAVWRNDGTYSGSEAALFGALSNASIHDLILDRPEITISSDGDATPYAAPLAGFDIASRLTNITVNEPVIQATVSDRNAQSRASAWLATSGLVAGGWSDVIRNCSVVDARIIVRGETAKSHGGEYYVGSMLGEGYAFMDGNSATYDLDVRVEDQSTALTDMDLAVNVGGMGGTNTTQTNGVFSGKMNVCVVKPVGASTVSIGGLTGSQRYQVAENNTIHAEVTANCQLDPDQGKLYVGKVIGSTNVPYCIVQLIFADPGDVASSGCRNNKAEVTLNGEPVTVNKGQDLTVGGETMHYIANGDVTDEETGEFYADNINAVIAEYGSAVPASFLKNALILIVDD